LCLLKYIKFDINVSVEKTKVEIHAMMAVERVA
jgi:hypothetical protein